MARFDVYESPDGAGYVVDVQADLLDMLQTRVVVPLLPLADAPKPANRLNPVFVIEGHEHAMVTQYIATVPHSILRNVVTDLRDDADRVIGAIDFVLSGF